MRWPPLVTLQRSPSVYFFKLLVMSGRWDGRLRTVQQGVTREGWRAPRGGRCTLAASRLPFRAGMLLEEAGWLQASGTGQQCWPGGRTLPEYIYNPSTREGGRPPRGGRCTLATSRLALRAGSSGLRTACLDYKLRWRKSLISAVWARPSVRNQRFLTLEASLWLKRRPISSEKPLISGNL